MDYTVDIICPVYNGEECILELDRSIKKQKNVKINSIKYVVTESKDNTEKILKDNNIKYLKINKEEFSHSKTREMVAKTCDANIIVFITQDIIIESKDWLYNLTSPIAKGECDASYSRQISKSKGIEKYTREKNYPEKSYIISKEDVKEKGLRTFFFSDASSAISNEVFRKLNYYDDKNLSINEDMYIAYKLIMNNYKIKYVADSVVIHSHNFKFKELYKRYHDTGIFFKENNYLDEYGTNKTGGGMAIYVLKRILQEKDFRAFFRFWPDMIARFVGMKFGKMKNEINYPKINIIFGTIIFIISMIFYYCSLNQASAGILMLSGIFLFCFNKKRYGYYTNSIGIFSLVWFFTIGLSTLRLHQSQVEWKIDTWFCFIITYIFFNVGYSIRREKKKEFSTKEDKPICKKINLIFITSLFILSFGIFILESVIEGYIPMFSNDMSAYQDFGVGKLHYFTVTCTFILPLSCIYYKLYKRDINKMEIVYLIIINILSFLIPFFIVSRFFIVMTVILTGLAIMEMNKKKEKVIIIFILIAGFLGWTVISQFRNQDETYLKQALYIQENAPLSVSNMQIYMYATMGYDNFDCNVNKIENYSFGAKAILPITEFLGLDTVIPNSIDVAAVADRIIPVFNTHSIIMAPYFDLGIVGIAIYMIIIGYISACTESLKTNNIINLLLKSLIKFALLFSFFVSYFSNKTFLFYVMLLLLGKVGFKILSFTKRGEKQNYEQPKDCNIDGNI